MAGAGTLAVLVGAVAGPLSSQVEQPKYAVLNSDGDIEVRLYGPMIVAEVSIQGDRSTALSAGFRLVAAYIFGANKPKAKVAMTAPVMQEGNETIPEVGSVSQQANGEAWTVRFIMPSGSTMESLPVPDDSRLHLVSVPAERLVAIRFSGLANGKALALKTAVVRQYAAEHKIETTGEPLLAYYNPPWTLPFLRRNEIMLRIASQSGLRSAPLQNSGRIHKGEDG